MFDIQTPKDHNLVEFARSACQEAVSLQRQIDAWEEAASAAKARLMALRTREIPEAMANAGLGSVMSLDTGEVITIGEIITGNLPKEGEERTAALDALISIGGEAIIKTEVVAQFPKGQYERAEAARNALMTIGIDASINETVHHATLKSFVKERVEGGEAVPLEVLGLYMGPMAKIVLPK
jgi:hypothetical protein